ncbi:unnamed protein product [[Candida] boidinii]|nr:unnamed protein product [[Candida] boidinii]
MVFRLCVRQGLVLGRGFRNGINGINGINGLARGVASTARARAGRVFPVLKSEHEIEQFLVNASWRAQELLDLRDSRDSRDSRDLKEGEAAEKVEDTVNEQVLESLMKLSGLSISAIDKDVLKKLLVSLEDQLRFTGKLQSLDTDTTDTTDRADTSPANQKAAPTGEQDKTVFGDDVSSTRITRLVGDRQVKELNYTGLMLEIQQHQQASPLKGETVGSWDPLQLSQEKDEDNYFVVNEGLLKKSKL